MNDEMAGLAAGDERGHPLIGLRPSGLDALYAQMPQAAAQARLTGFTAASGQVMQLPDAALLGLGAAPALHGFGAGAQALPAGSLWHLAGEDFDRDEAALGFLLGAYRFAPFKAKPRASALLAARDAGARVRAIAAGTMLARDLINMPANHLGPPELAQAALDLAARHGAAAERVEGPALAARYPALAAVGAGSARGPVAVLLHWQGAGAGDDAPLVSLCGKGVCFDTGGYDLKPGSAMLKMKKDMGGAAILLGLSAAVMALNLPIKLQLRIGCVENSVSGAAMRPSDIIRTRAGLSVEIGNTDAEGRLVLCDLLAEASAERPRWLIDAATLTGAARAALGPDLPALFCSDDDMAKALLQAGQAAHDPLWRMPLFDAYEGWLDSPVADMNNISSKPYAGAIIAALFLRRFVAKDLSWAHIDVFAWNDSARPGRPEGGEAQSLRALLGAIERLGPSRTRDVPAPMVSPP